jgi:hypothetical protein
MKRVRKVLLAGVAAAALLAGCGSAHPGPATAHSPSPGSVRTAPATTASPSAEVIAARMGLTKAPGYVAYTAATDPNHLLGRQNGYTSKVNWGPDGDTGTIEVFPDRADAIARQDYIKGFTCPFGFGYLTMTVTADLRLGCDVTPAQAAPIEARFREAAVTS